MHDQDRIVAVYIMASRRNGTIYTGMTADLMARIWQHRNGVTKGFTHEHGCKTLVWYETCDSIVAAICREKQIKKWRRKWKLALIEASNPQWLDLAGPWFDEGSPLLPASPTGPHLP
jgi:putative endonuclease